MYFTLFELSKCSTPDAKVQIPKMIQWQDIKLPTEWLLEQESPLVKPIFDELDLTHIQQYLDSTVKISFQNNQPLRINEGRHSFARSENISKRDQDLNDFLQKSLENPTGLRLKGVSSSNSQVSTPFYSTKPIFDELDLTHIQQYLDGTVKINSQNNPPLRINEGRHSFAGSESISKRDQEINDFLKKNLEKPSEIGRAHV